MKGSLQLASRRIRATLLIELEGRLGANEQRRCQNTRTPEEVTVQSDNSASPESARAAPAGPTHEEEMRGAQAPNHDPSGDSVRQRDVRDTGKVQDVVDLDQVDETGAVRSAHRRPR